MNIFHSALYLSLSCAVGKGRGEGPTHVLETFDCGVPSLNEGLKRRSQRNEQEGASRTYVVCSGQQVVGYYCLSTG